MPTLPLYDPHPPTANAPHHVAVPGGYESWHFHIYDPAQHIRILAAFHDGYPLHPDYLRRFRAYRRNPTHVAPPTPSDYPCMTLAIYEKEWLLAGSITQYSPGSLHYSGHNLSLDKNQARFCTDQIHVELSQPGCLVLQTSDSLPIAKTQADHHWLYAHPHCPATGNIQIGTRKIEIAGIAQHNHYFSARPLDNANLLITGAILLPNSAINFRAIDDELAVLTTDPSGFHEIPSSPLVSIWNRRTTSFLQYPSSLQIGDWLLLRNPKLVSASPARACLLFDAYVHGEQATAWLEVTAPKRLHNPFFAWRKKQRIIMK